MTNEKLKLWIFIDWYLPAYKAGGPIQSVSNLVVRLKSEFDISVITSNLDLGEPLDLETEDLNVWREKDGYRVMYLNCKNQNRKFYKKLFSKNTIDVVYFNSLFSKKFTVLPLLILKNTAIRRVLASRGMLGKGALAIKPLKKKLFLEWFKFMNLHKKVIWHATAKSESDEIKMHFGKDITIALAPNLSALSRSENFKKKKLKYQINIFFLSRIAIKKNLIGALEFLSKIQITSQINFTIIGPVDDKAYWQKCQMKIKSLQKHLRVDYLGAIPNHELSNHLKEQHILLLPTYGENFGHVIMESWQNGCPVVISDQTPWRALKKDKLGYDIAIKNEREFIEAIEHLIKMPQDEYAQWSNSAFEFAKKFIENPKVLEQNKALFLTD